MSVRSAFPILLTPDMPAALGFYRDLLGGEVDYEFPGPDGEPVYVSVRLGDSTVALGLDSQPSSVTLWLYVDDVDAEYTRLVAAGAPSVAEPRDEVWGERTARVADPAGNVVVLGAAIG
ncbi:VOC family protein [Microbacteriaceae bacterium VKM Ac-2854]|nr:VOC family protein [Microbacteriaceae bacterium VKM Ac-2854]